MGLPPCSHPLINLPSNSLHFEVHKIKNFVVRVPTNVLNNSSYEELQHDLSGLLVADRLHLNRRKLAAAVRRLAVAVVLEGDLFLKLAAVLKWKQFVTEIPQLLRFKVLFVKQNVFYLWTFEVVQITADWIQQQKHWTKMLNKMLFSLIKN